jgi:hypothetical protein
MAIILERPLHQRGSDHRMIQATRSVNGRDQLAGAEFAKPKIVLALPVIPAAYDMIVKYGGEQRVPYRPKAFAALFVHCNDACVVFAPSNAAHTIANHDNTVLDHRQFGYGDAPQFS